MDENIVFIDEPSPELIIEIEKMFGLIPEPPLQA